MKQEIIEVSKRELSCDGGKDFGHPEVYFTIANNKEDVTCPYCSRLFVYKP